jgi:hypothetical protein
MRQQQVSHRMGSFGDLDALFLVTLSAWVIDYLLWFPRMHPTTQAGFGAYLSHSWYVIPLLLMIVVRYYLLRHDSPHPRQAATDQTTALSSRAMPKRFQTESNLLGDYAWNELPAEASALARRLLAKELPVERDLLTFLWNHSSTAMTPTDLAAQVGYPEDAVTVALQNLNHSRYISAEQMAAITFYRLTGAEDCLEEIGKFMTWRSLWLNRTQQFQRLLGAEQIASNNTGQALRRAC